MATPLHEMSREEIDGELAKYRALGFERPTRSQVDETRPWKHSVPSYDIADLAYFRGKSKNHAAGSLESVVENVVKQWECEATHLDFDDWQTVDHASYAVSANGAKKFIGEEGARAGNYNWLLAGVDPSVYDASKESFESSHEKFRGTFIGAFPWELLEVFSGPPVIAFSWRHWGLFNGEYEGRKGDGQVYDMYGFGVVKVNADLKIQEIAIYYKPEEFLNALNGRVHHAELHNGKSLLGSGCPVLNKITSLQSK